MSVLSRLGSRVVGAAIRFAGRATKGWSYLSSRIARDEWLVGDGSGNSIVQAAVGWIARNFPEAPVRVRVEDQAGELAVAQDDGSKRFLELLRSPNEFYSGILLWVQTIVEYWITGNGYWLKSRHPDTREVVALWWIPTATIEPKWPEDGTVFISHYLYRPLPEVEIKIAPEDVVHFRWGFDPDNIRVGRSPLRTVLREIFTDEEASTYTGTVLRNLGIPGVVISPDSDDVEIEEADAETIKKQFTAQFSGDRRGEPMVVGSRARVSVLSFSPNEMNLRDLRKIPEERVSGVLGVPAIVAGLGAGLDRSTFANYGEAREAGYEENIIPTQRILSADLRGQLLVDFVPDISAHRVDFDVSDVRVLQEDENKLWLRVGAAAKDGIITIADFNRAVGLPVDKKLHDVYLRPAMTVAIRVDAPEAIGEAEPAPEPAPTQPPGSPGANPDDVVPGTVPIPPVTPAAGNGNGVPVGAPR